MMTFKFSRGEGTFVIDRRYKGIGRIRRASGTKSKKTFRSLLEMLEQLHDTGKHDVLREIQAGIISPKEALGYWQSGKLDHLPSAASLQMVDPVVLTWISQRNDVVPVTRRNYRQVIERFVKHMGNHSIHDIPDRLKKYRKTLTDKPSTFRKTRTTLMAFLRETFGRSSVLWQQVSEIKLLDYAEEQAPELEVVEAYELLKKLPSHHADIARAMMFTGMHWGELADEWEVRKDRIWILGAKKKNGKRRTREVPLTQEVSKPTRSEKAFRVALKKIRNDLQIYSFRQTYVHWLEMAKVPRSRRHAYMGHGWTDMTDRYERHEVSKFLEEDAELVRDYIRSKLMPGTIKEIFGDALIEPEKKETRIPTLM